VQGNQTPKQAKADEEQAPRIKMLPEELGKKKLPVPGKTFLRLFDPAPAIEE
jgi:hypothetical protein